MPLKPTKTLEKAVVFYRQAIQNHLILSEGLLENRLDILLQVIRKKGGISSLPEPLQQIFADIEESVEWDLPTSKEKASIQTRIVAKLLNFYEQLVVARHTEIHGLDNALRSGPESLITQAIRKKCKIAFHYHGYPRAGDPYIYGVSPKGKEAIQLYQTGGGSSSRTIDQFKYFVVKDMEKVRLLSKPFTPDDEMDEEYDPDDWFFMDIFEQV
ncbi:MAG: hypothetical protein QE263_01845 [Vampirovibrionales bacterium]|nr:hypothetical protein [Vampirovibrionales bacterium]